MLNDERIRAAKELGTRLADATLARRRAARATRAAALEAFQAESGAPAERLFAEAAGPPTAGRLVALGDSWFDYFGDDILSKLHHKHGYDIESAAHAGAAVEFMAYTGGQIDEFADCLHKSGPQTKAILLSGGGNDIVANDFGLLLNNAVSPIAGWNSEILSGIIDTRVLTAYCTLVAQINVICQNELGHVVPIVVHGYDYLVPDGRGILGGWWFLPGPWLRPAFHDKLFPNLEVNTLMMRDVIKALNDMLAVLPTVYANVHHLDLRGTLPTELIDDAYQEWWANELHPTDEGFAKLAQQFDDLISTL